MDNPSNYFTSNTTVVFLFPPGHHEVSTEGQLAIQNVNNIVLVGDNKDNTKIKCIGRFGLVFMNITNLTVSRLSFSMCGAPMDASQLVITHSLPFPNILQLRSIVSICLLGITNLIATNLVIHCSKEMGLLAVNIFGASSIQQAVFVNNTPNCVIVFLDSYSPIVTPVLYITNSSFMFGTVSGIEYVYSGFAAGLSIIAVQTIYHVKCYIENVTAYGNTGSTYGNMYFNINCKMEIKVAQVNLTEGHHNGLVLDFKIWRFH